MNVMRMRTKGLSKTLTLLSLVLLLVLAACGQGGGSSSGSSSGSGTGSATSSSPSGSQDTGSAPDRSKWPKGISVSAAPLGGTFHVYATAWGQIISRELGVTVNVEATAGPIANVQLVDMGDSEIGLVTMGPAYEGYNGIGWADKKHENIRGIFPMYLSYLHYVAMPQANVKSIEDLNGKAVGTGAKGGTPDYYSQLIFEDLGIQPKRIVNASFDDYANQMSDGLLDAFGTFSPTGHPTASELVRTKGANIIGVGPKSKELAPKYGITYGFIGPNSYEGQTEPIETLTIWSAFVAHKDLPDDFVYELVKTSFETTGELVNAVKQAQEMTPSAAVEALQVIPVHPGALKYYEELGFVFPESAYPPEYPKQ
jgi:hypothetical protein